MLFAMDTGLFRFTLKLPGDLMALAIPLNPAQARDILISQ